MRTAICGAFILLLLLVCEARSEDQIPDPRDNDPHATFDGLDPDQLDPALRSYLLQAEQERMAEELKLRTVIYGPEIARELAEKAQQAKDRLAQEQQILDNAKATALSKVATSADYQRACSDLAAAQRTLDQAGDDWDARSRAAVEKANARATLDKLEEPALKSGAVQFAQFWVDVAAGGYKEAQASVADFHVVPLTDKEREALKSRLKEIVKLKGKYRPPIGDLTLVLFGNPRNTAAGSVGVFGCYVQVDQVVDGQNMLVSPLGGGSAGQSVWIDDLDTSGVVDGTRLPIKSELILLGSKTFPTTTGGNKTVYELRAFDPDAEVQAAKTAQGLDK